MRHVPGVPHLQPSLYPCECSSIYNLVRVPGHGQEQDQEGSSEGEEEEEPIQFQVIMMIMMMIMMIMMMMVMAAGETHGRRGHQAQDRRARGRGGQRSRGGALADCR